MDGYHSKLTIQDNVEYTLRDASGKIKKLFQENGLTRWLLKKGILNPHWTFIQSIPFIFGSWSETKLVSNLITSAGKALVAGRINGSGAPAAATYIALGTGTNAASAGDTALQTETSASGLARANASVSLVTTSVTNDTAQLSNTFTSGASAAITEEGILNAASTGTLLARQVFSAINVVNGDTLTITHKVQVS